MKKFKTMFVGMLTSIGLVMLCPINANVKEVEAEIVEPQLFETIEEKTEYKYNIDKIIASNKEIYSLENMREKYPSVEVKQMTVEVKRQSADFAYTPVSNPEPSESDATPSDATPQKTYLGRYKLTAYCACSRCCGKSDGVTAIGTIATEGRTVACNSLSLGTQIIINGNLYTVEDRGGMGSNVIDVFFNSHQAALNFGVQYADVYLAN